MNFNKLSGLSRMFSNYLKPSRSILFEPVYLQFIRFSSTDSIDSTDFPLESLFVRSRFSYYTDGVQHHLGLPTFSYILKLWTSNIGKVLTDLHKHRSSLPPEVSDVSKPKLRMRHSFMEAILPLSIRDDIARKRYFTGDGLLRLGPILEDLDVFGGFIANEHIKQMYLRAGVRLPLCLVVTGMVDRIKLNRFEELPTDRDIKLSGCVTWVGRSTIEVSIQLHQATPLQSTGTTTTTMSSPSRTNASLKPEERASLTNMYPPPATIFIPFYPNSQPVIAPPPAGMRWTPILESRFLMMSRSVLDFGAFAVSELETLNEREREMFLAGEHRNKVRKRFREESLLRTVPKGHEVEELHRLFLAGLRSRLHARSTPDDVHIEKDTVAIGDTRLQNHLLCHPEQRNMLNRIFGGFLMLQATELATACATAHCQRRVNLLAIDHFHFLQAVEVGALLALEAHVVYVADSENASASHVTVRIDANNVNFENPADRAPCNTAYFVFSADETGSSGCSAPASGGANASSAVSESTSAAESGSEPAAPTASATSDSASFRPRVYRVQPDTYESAVMYLQGRRHYQQILQDNKHSSTMRLEELIQ